MKLSNLLLFLSIIFLSQAQLKNITPAYNSSITIGILNGGGALIGADYEFMSTPNIGLQIGGGLIAYGFALNYHPAPGVQTSFMSLSYWNQGWGQNFVQRIIGLSYVYRSTGWLTGQIGLGIPIAEGPAMPAGVKQRPLMLLYSIGAVFPRY